MPTLDRKSLAFAALIVAALPPLTVAAQAQFSISNPLVKPQSRRLAAPAPGPGGGKAAAPDDGARVPVARPVPDGSPAQPPQWPGAGAAGGVPSQSGESAAKEELAAYTVVAIVGDAAVLRTNVGQAVSHGAATAGAAPGQPAAMTPPGQAQQQTARQLAMRVRTGQAMMVGGSSVVPAVGISTVEFRSARSKALLFTASLDSQSPQAFVPATRETADPSVAARATPTPPNISGITPAAANGAGAAGAAGSTAAQR